MPGSCAPSTARAADLTRYRRIESAQAASRSAARLLRSGLKASAALEDAGIVFIPANGGGLGVRLKDPEYEQLETQSSLET